MRRGSRRRGVVEHDAASMARIARRAHVDRKVMQGRVVVRRLVHKRAAVQPPVTHRPGAFHVRRQRRPRRGRARGVSTHRPASVGTGARHGDWCFQCCEWPSTTCSSRRSIRRVRVSSCLASVTPSDAFAAKFRRRCIEAGARAAHAFACGANIRRRFWRDAPPAHGAPRHPPCVHRCARPQHARPV